MNHQFIKNDVLAHLMLDTEMHSIATHSDLPRSRPHTPLLDTIDTPMVLKSLSLAQLRTLGDELRAYLLYSVGLSGGHFGANLGVIELTIALHWAFDSPQDKIIWDVGHQAYAHKVLTGRREQLPSIRTQGGLTAFPERSESLYDSFGVGHSSTSISAGVGMSLALRQQQQTALSTATTTKQAKVVCVIGDGAMSAGMAFEAINDAVQHDANIIIILNDNNMSISCSTGGLSDHLNQLSSSHTTNETNATAQTTDNIFTALGLHYIGIIDGHNTATLMKVLHDAQQLTGAVLIHIKTIKGRGFAPAERDPVGYHAIDKLPAPVVSSAVPSPSICQGSTHQSSIHQSSIHQGSIHQSSIHQGSLRQSPLKYSEVFGQWLCDYAERDQRLVAITPAMTKGSGMTEFALHYPQRFFDVAIAEQHAVTLAAGMATQGLKPIVAIYSTFLQRGYDQLIHDVAIQGLDVTFAIDRAGLVGADGATHAGVFDCAFMRCIPNIIIACPKDENDCYQLLNVCYEHTGASAIRYPRGVGVGVDIVQPVQAHKTLHNANISHTSNTANSDTTNTYAIGMGRIEKEYTAQADNVFGMSSSASSSSSSTLATTPEKKLAVLAFGTVCQSADSACKRFTQATGIACTLVDMRWVKPLDTALITQLLADTITHIATIEEHAIMGGAGSAVNEFLVTQDQAVTVVNLGIDDGFVAHGSHQQQRQACGLDVEGIYASLIALSKR